MCASVFWLSPGLSSSGLVSGAKRVAYVSCNPLSWSRDGALLVAAGYKLVEVRPVGQFRWSTHVELASLFVK